MINYAKIAQQAAAAIRNAGGPVIVRAIAATYDPAQGKPASSTSTDTTLQGVLLDFTAGDQFGPGGQMIIAGDRRLLVEVGVVITPAHRLITADGHQWSVVGVKEMKPNGLTPVLYDVHVRA